MNQLTQAHPRDPGADSGGEGKLEASLCNKDKEINALKMKIVSLETRASSAEQENDSRKLALKLIMQEMSVGERQQQRNQSYQVTAP